MGEDTLVRMILLLLVVLLVLYSVQGLRRSLRGLRYRTGSMIGRLGWLLEAIRLHDVQINATPKTLSVKESLYLDAIRRDFPELNLDLAKSYMNEIVSAYLHCLETGDSKPLEEGCTENFVMQARSSCNGRAYRNIRVHRTVINDYKKSGTEARILFQTACQYTLQNKVCQTRFETNYMYYLKETRHHVSALLRCSYCGAPLEGVGEKKCRYCGNGVVDTMKKVWKFSDIREF